MPQEMGNSRAKRLPAIVHAGQRHGIFAVVGIVGEALIRGAGAVGCESRRDTLRQARREVGHLLKSLVSLINESLIIGHKLVKHAAVGLFV